MAVSQRIDCATLPRRRFHNDRATLILASRARGLGTSAERLDIAAGKLRCLDHAAPDRAVPAISRWVNQLLTRTSGGPSPAVAKAIRTPSRDLQNRIHCVIGVSCRLGPHLLQAGGNVIRHAVPSTAVKRYRNTAADHSQIVSALATLTVDQSNSHLGSGHDDTGANMNVSNSNSRGQSRRSGDGPIPPRPVRGHHHLCAMGGVHRPGQIQGI
jgi:hypothetical protein